MVIERCGETVCYARHEQCVITLAQCVCVCAMAPIDCMEAWWCKGRP